jgi:DNA polymerase-3 subunit alpha
MFLREECLKKLEEILKAKSGLSEAHIKDIMTCAKVWPDKQLDRIASDMFKYAELHVHSDRSTLDGLGTVIDHALVAASYGHPGLAITDHGKTSGWSDYMFSKKIPSDFKKIYGCEVYVNLGTSDKPSNKYVHLLLLAKNNLGRKNVLRLVSKASIGGINVRAKATIPMDAFTTESLKGVIVTSACLGGPIAHIFTEESEKEDFDAEKCYLQMKEEALRWKSMSEHFYLEVQNYEADNAEDFNSFREDEVAFANQQLAYNEFLYRISAETGIPVVATNDCHYQKPEDAEIQDILLCISTKKSLADPDRLRFQSRKHYIKTKWYMLWLFRQHPEAVCNTEEILNLINYEEEKHGYFLPLYPLTDTKEEQIAIFHELVSKGLREFYGKPENLKPLIEKFGSREKALNTIKERADFEKEVLLNMGFEGYMLLVSWCIEIARENNVLVGHGRGSAAGSIVALALKITDLCPLRYDLIFERFLNPDRISMPDIDVDYQYEHRAHVIELIQQKIGADKMAQIVTFGRMKAKAAIRNAGKVLDIPLTTVDKIAKMIPMGPKVTIASAIEESSALQTEIKNPQIAKLIEVAKSIEGRIKNTSVHAAGVILSSVPITDVCALENGKGAILPVVQAEMSNVDYLGLVKQDFLGLRTLSVIAAAIDFINKRHNVNLRYEDIPRDDAKTYKLLAAGETTACFQLESAGMQQLMRDIHIETVTDVIDCIALFRPGVLKVGMHKEYVKNKYNPQNISYIHPLMEKVLAPSRGILIYQEQAMQLSNHLAGFTMAEADTLRKAIGKKNLELMAELKEKFVVGCKKTNNIDSQTATKIWELIEVMSGYSFNKSHSAAYAMTSIDTAYLKANYPIEFMTAAISKAAEGKSPKLATYLEEARRMGIPVLAPDINKSETWFSISENNEIVFGLQAIKDVGKCADQIVEERLLNGPFTDIVDFRKRCQFANKKTLVSLVKVGAFDKLGYNRNVLLAVLDDVLKIKPKVTKKNPEPHFNEEYNILYPEIEAPSKKEILNLEMELCSIFITDHPFSEFLPYVESNIINGGKGNRVEDFHSGEMMDESWVYFGAYVLNEKITKTKKGDEMAILTLDDISAQVDAVIFPAVYEKVKDLVTEGESFMFKGKLQYKEDFFSKSSDEDDADEGSADMIPQIIINAVETFPAVKNTVKDEDYISFDVWSKGKTITIC